ncbi:hypothetical protein [Ancylomarina longa]|uniref:Uncharacterized protein n=1 Tax=Ancylomarina longa TaxID=2487017 RepID=A0A434AXN7_9BACT|nr:hypothetical protein [Ancylomarina longa]RUT79180.1 hypothetical protein DLK05_05015 [Ancylomarina longa]
MSARYFKFRQEELPVAGDLMLQLINRDISDFEAFSPEYNGEYVTGVRNQISKVRDLTQSPLLTAEIAKITEDLYLSMDQVLPLLNRIAAYAQRANKSLNIKYAAFGVKEAKKNLRSRNVEGYCAKVKVVQQNIANNLEALKGKGYKEELGTELETLTQKIYDLNLVQEGKLRERKQLVIDNNSEFNVLWSMLSDISKTGKLVMSYDKTKADDYRLNQIIKLVRKPVVVEKIKPIPVSEPSTEIPTPRAEVPNETSEAIG